MPWVIAYLFQSVMMVFALDRWMRVFFEQRRTRPVIMYLFYFFNSIASSLVFLLLNVPIITMLVSILLVFGITWNYESSSVLRRIVATVSYFLFVTLTEFLVVLIYVSHSDATFVVGSEFDGSVHILVGLLTCLLSMSVQRFKNIRKNYITTNQFWVSIIIVPLLSISIMVVVFLSSSISQVVSIFIVVMLFGINLFIVYFHDVISKAFEDRYKALLAAKEKEYYISQCQVMQESMDKMKSFRHDTKIHLATINNFAAKENMDEITGYISLLLNDLEKSEVYSDTGNLAFDSIINYKLRNVSSNDIKLNLDVFIPPVLNFEIIDIVTILGNILDNALDAIEKMEEKWLTLSIQLEKGMLLIKMKNPFDGVIEFKNGNDGEIISTKQGEEHGYGIRNIKKAVEKYNGDLKISAKEHVFSLSILLFSKT